MTVSAAFLALLPSTASAATYSNRPSGSRCLVLYCNTGRVGSKAAFTSSASNFAGYAFLSSGSGQEQALKSDAASASLLTYPTNDVKRCGVLQ
ncbi:hypothetical protein [Streptomyces incanus]